MKTKKLLNGFTLTLGGVAAITALLTFGLTNCATNDTFPSISPTPGLPTIKNLLSTSLVPVGRTLYVWGGG
jgi:hypothetical protein